MERGVISAVLVFGFSLTSFLFATATTFSHRMDPWIAGISSAGALFGGLAAFISAVAVLRRKIDAEVVVELQEDLKEEKGRSERLSAEVNYLINDIAQHKQMVVRLMEEATRNRKLINELMKVGGIKQVPELDFKNPGDSTLGD